MSRCKQVFFLTVPYSPGDQQIHETATRNKHRKQMHETNGETGPGRTHGRGNSRTRLGDWSAITAKFVSGCMAAANCDDPLIPRVALVLKVWESMIDIVLLKALTVRMV